MDIHTYALPNPMWQWVSDHPKLQNSLLVVVQIAIQSINIFVYQVNKDWLADMTGDVDESGWEYAFQFHGSTWHGELKICIYISNLAANIIVYLIAELSLGNYKHFRSFARRRKWIRLRRRRMLEDDESYHSDDAVSIHTASIPENDESAQGIEEKENKLYERLQKCRLDRERLKVVDDILQENDTQLEMIQAKVSKPLDGSRLELTCSMLDIFQLNDYMQLFDFEDSRRKFALVSCSSQSPSYILLPHDANYPLLFSFCSANKHRAKTHRKVVLRKFLKEMRMP
jgi:hypothetical protein